MFNIKVQYKGKIINLGKNIDSLQKMHQQMKARFPIEFKYGVECSYNMQKIQNFDQVVQIVKKLNVSSIKLKVIPKERARSELKEQHNSAIRDSMKPQQTIAIQLNSEIKIQRSSLAMSGSNISEKKSKGSFVKANSKEHIIQAKIQRKNSSKISTNQKKIQQAQKKPEIQQVKQQKIEIKTLQNNLFQAKSEQIEKLERKNSSKRIPIFSQKRSPLVQSSNQRSANTPESKKSAKSVQKKIQLKKNQVKPLLSHQIAYPCVICNGSGKYTFDTQCQLCSGVGYWNRQNKLLVFLRKIINQQITKASISKQLIKEQVEKKEIPLDILRQDYSFELAETEKIFKKQAGEQFYWKVKLVNTGSKWADDMFIVSQETGEALDVGKINSKQGKIFNIGPISCNRLGKIQKIYKLGYYDSNGKLNQVGYKFGFTVNVVPKENKITLTNTFRTRLINLTKKHHLNKSSIEFYIEKFKEIGINEQTHKQMNQQALFDMLVVWNK